MDVKWLVIGGGPAGLTAAYSIDAAMRKVGSQPSVVVLEKRAPWPQRRDKRAQPVSFDSYVLACLERCGLDTSVLRRPEHALNTLRLTIGDTDHAVLRLLPEDQRRTGALLKHLPVGHPLAMFTALFLRRAPIASVPCRIAEDVLYRNVKGAHIEILQAQDTVARLHGDHVSVEFGPPDKRETITAERLVVADGANSPTAVQLGARRPAAKPLHRLAWGLFKNPHPMEPMTRFHRDPLNPYMPEAWVNLIRDYAGISVVLDWTGERRDKKTITEQWVHPLVLQAAQTLGVKGKLVKHQLLEPRLQSSKPLIGNRGERDRVFRIGDSRHSTTPKVGMGLNCGVLGGLRVGDLAADLERAPNSAAERRALNRFARHNQAATRMINLLAWAATRGEGKAIPLGDQPRAHARRRLKRLAGFPPAAWMRLYLPSHRAQGHD